MTPPAPTSTLLLGEENGASALLDNHREVFVRSVRDANRTKERVVFRRRRLASIALRESFPDHAIHTCGLHPVPGEQASVIRFEDGRHGYANVISCGSVWVCARCRARVASSRRAEVQQALDAAAEQGLYAYFVTATVQHRATDRLKPLWTGLRESLKATCSGRPWRRWVASTGFVGRITAHEVTYGASGWHPHAHLLMFCREELSDDDIDALWEQWRHATSTRGMYASKEAFVVKKVTPGTSASMADYMSKVSVAKPEESLSWGAASELTRADVKQARGDRCTPLELLDRFEHGGDLDDRDAFVEYVGASKGVQSLRWSSGLRDLLGLTGEQSDVEVANTSDVEGETVRTMTPREWTAVRLGGFDGILLTVADQEGAAGVDRVIEEACRSFYGRRSLS